MALRPSQEKLIRCANCGEDYSPTYKKCPFCGARNDPRTSAAPVSGRPAARYGGSGDDYPEEEYTQVTRRNAPTRISGSRRQDSYDDYDEPAAPARSGGRRLIDDGDYAEPAAPARVTGRRQQQESDDYDEPAAPVRSGGRRQAGQEEDRPQRSASGRTSGRQSDYDDGYVFEGQDVFDDEDEDYRPARGGKRLAGGNGGGDGGSARGFRPGKAEMEINWPRVITFLCSLVIIIAAMVIVFTWIYPKLHKDPTPSGTNPVDTQPAVTDPSGGATTPGGESTDPAGQPTPGGNDPQDGDLIGITFESAEVTVMAGESRRLTPIFEPSDWAGEVTWTCDDPQHASVSEDGTVTNLNTDPGTNYKVTVTISAGGIYHSCTVYCMGPDQQATQPPVTEPPVTAPPATQPPASSAPGSLTPGSRGVITGADGGLRVRSGPGTTYDKVASLKNGDVVTVVRDAGNGWYEITFSGSGGNPTPGYIMGEYISVT